MGSKPKAPDMSAQNRAAQEQSDALKKQQEETRIAKEALASKNTDELRAIRRRGRGRASLITTSEKGTESNRLDKAGDVAVREGEISRINAEGEVATAERAKQKTRDERKAAALADAQRNLASRRGMI